jgi:hypothetical protein
MTSPHSLRERWLEEWVSYGFRQMDEYLAKQAEFARYCERRAAEAPASRSSR